MATRLIVNADDYGYTTGTSLGIRQAFTHGVLSVTTAMMNAPGVDDDIAEGLVAAPDLPLGVHLVLTADAPVSAAEEVPSLVGPDSKFHLLGHLSTHLEDLVADEVAIEWTRQIERLLAHGITLDHLDSHHHVSYLSPALAEVQLDLAERYGVAVRRPPPLESHPDVPPLFAASRVPMPDLFIGDLMQGSSPAKFKSLVDAVPDGAVAEVMVHPAVVDDTLVDRSTYAAPRAAELTTLLDPSVAAHLQQHDVAPVSFREALRSAGS